MANFCTNCGAQIVNGARFCNECGNPIGNIPKTNPWKIPLIVGISAVTVIAVVIIVLCVTGVIGGSGVYGGKTERVQESTAEEEYAEKQREENDLNTLSTVASAIASALADAKATGEGYATIKDGIFTCSDSNVSSFFVKMVEPSNVKLESKVATSGKGDGTIHLKWSFYENTVKVFVGEESDIVIGEYTNKPFLLTNGE